MKLINLERGLDTSNEVNLRLVPRLVFLGTCSLHLEPGNSLNHGNFVKNGGSRSMKCVLSEANQLGTWSCDTSNEVNLRLVPWLVFLGTYSLHLEPGNGLNYGNFVKNVGSRSMKCDVSAVNQLGMGS